MSNKGINIRILDDGTSCERGKGGLPWSILRGWIQAKVLQSQSVPVKAQGVCGGFCEAER